MIQNLYVNRKTQSNNTTGKAGVVMSANGKSYIAKIKFYGKDIHLGTFKDFDVAVKARENAELIYGLAKDMEVPLYGIGK